MEVTKDKRNYVFYVSDMDVLPDTGHFRKMDAERSIAEHIGVGMDNCSILPFTQYDGGVLDAGSIGIVFPTHMWGVSLAVYTFLQHLRVNESSYVYAIAVGESMSEAVDATLVNRTKILEQFIRIFVRCGFGTKEDIYVRCIDRKRNLGTTEESLKGCIDNKQAVRHVMRGLLFHNLKELAVCDAEEDVLKNSDIYDIRRNRAFDVSKAPERLKKLPEVSGEKKTVLENMFLNDDWLAGVKLCRVM